MTGKTNVEQKAVAPEVEKAGSMKRPHYTLVVQSARHTLKLTKQEDRQDG